MFNSYDAEKRDNEILGLIDKLIGLHKTNEETQRSSLDIRAAMIEIQQMQSAQISDLKKRIESLEKSKTNLKGLDGNGF